MKIEILSKAHHLVYTTKVMTLAVSEKDIPWSSPVYFVFLDSKFYFFSNENSRHIKITTNNAPVAASIFHDSDDIGQIFGFQMSGIIKPVPGNVEYFRIVSKYVTKFQFLKKAFGHQVLEKKNFFLNKFKSKLYFFQPEKIILSDNSNSSGKREEFELTALSGL